MLAIISIIVGIVGFGLAGWKDLKTTEFPDWIPYSLIISGLVIRAVFSFLSGDFMILVNSVITGCLFLGFGLLLYHFKQWGDGDAWLLGAMGFLFPDKLGIDVGLSQIVTQGITLPFPVMLLFNFFFVAFFYIVVYSIAIGLKDKETRKFFVGFKRHMIRIAGISIVFAIGIVGLVFYTGLSIEKFSYLFISPVLLFFLLLFMQYGKFIEKNVFKKKISVKELRVGDVPADDKWRVLDQKEIDALKKKGGDIWVKEGVRFAPVFVLTIISMVLYGNLWSIILQFI